jgi:hypothetical protein
MALAGEEFAGIPDEQILRNTLDTLFNGSTPRRRPRAAPLTAPRAAGQLSRGVGTTNGHEWTRTGNRNRRSPIMSM